MDVIYAFNGLGNQMSQYAFYLAKHSKNKEVSFLVSPFTAGEHNGYELGRLFGVRPSADCLAKAKCDRILKFNIAYGNTFFIKVLRRLPMLFGIRFLRERRNYNFNPQVFNERKGLNIYYGGWHSEKYFSDLRSLICDKFSFKTDELNSTSLAVLDQVKTSNSVSIHIRRGDFVDKANYNVFGCVCDAAYYQRAIDYVMTQVENPQFFIFSNDFQWVKQELSLPEDSVFVEGNSGSSSWMDMCLMSNCSHNIIANSTFSWWGAWLNQNPSKIVAHPSEFIHNRDIKDFYPESWTEI